MDENEMLALLTRGMDTRMVPVKFRKSEYQLPACRRGEEDNFRISHATLQFYFRKVKKEYLDIKLEMKKDYSYISLGYCIAACTLITKDGESDIYFGENRVSAVSSGADRDAPFQIAVNRAQDKVIYREIFGLESRYFTPDGKPVLYDDFLSQQDNNAETEENNSAVNCSNANGNGIGEKIFDNKEISKELQQLGQIKLRLNKDGKMGEYCLRDLSDKLLLYFTTAKETELSIKKQICRFLELKKL